MSLGVFSHDGSYSYEELQRYFQELERVPADCDSIFSYIRHLIQKQPDLKKCHVLEDTLINRVSQVADQSGLAALASQVSALMHKEMPKSLVANHLDNPKEVLELLWSEDDLNIKFDVMIELAYHHPKEVMREQRFFLLFSDEQRRAIAFASANKDPRLVLQKINVLKMDDEDNTLFILTTILQSDWSQLSFLLEHSVLDESLLKKLFVYCEEARPYELLQLVDQFKIKDQQFVKRQAFLFAKKYPDLTFQFQSQFKLNPAERAELIRVCIHHGVDRGGLIEALVRLSQTDLLEVIRGEEDQEILQAIAFACARLNSTFLAIHLREFKIQDQKVLEMLARKLAETDCKTLLCCLEAFAIQDPSVRLELAKKMLATYPNQLAQAIKRFQIVEDRDRFDLAFGFLEQAGPEDQLTITSVLKEFAIQEPQLLLVLARQAIQKFPVQVAAQINLFGIQKQEDLFALALESIHRSKGRSITHIYLFKITDLQQRIFLAEEGAKLNGQFTAHALLKLKISDPEAVVRIATSCAASYGDIFEHMDAWEIGEGVPRLQIALACAKKFPEHVIAYWDTLRLIDEESRFQIAVVCAEVSQQAVIQSIQLFQLEEEHRFVIAKQCVGSMLPMHFKRFQIKNPAQKQELIERCIEVAPEEVAACLDEFDIQDQVQRYEILKQCLIKGGSSWYLISKVIESCHDDQKIKFAEQGFEKDPNEFIAMLPALSISSELKLSFLKRYASYPDPKIPNIVDCKIEDLESRHELAWLYAERNPNALARDIRYFGIEEEAERFKIAQVCLAKDPASIPKNVHRFDLNSDHLYELAVQCAQANQSQFPHFFSSFKITDSKQVLKIALISAEHHGLATVENLKQFQITDAADRLQVIQACARSVPEQLHLVVNSLNIPSIKDRIALAKLAMISSPLALSYLGQFGLSKEENIELISLYAKRFPEDFKKECVHIIDSRLIESEEERIRLAEIGCDANPALAIQKIENFGIEDRRILLKLITKMALCQDLETLHSILGMDWTLEEWETLYKILELTQSGSFVEMLTEEQLRDFGAFAGCAAILKEQGNSSLSIDTMNTYYPEIRAFLRHHHHIIDQEKLPEVGSELTFAQIKKIAIAYLGLRAFSPDKLKHSIIREAFSKLINHRNKSQALFYLSLLVHGTSLQMIHAFHLGTQKALKKGSQEPYGKPLAPLLIPLLMCAKWADECHQPELLLKLNQIFREESIRTKYFKAQAESSDSMVQVWLQTVQILDQVKTLSPYRKIRLLTQAATNIKALRDRLLAIQGVICSGETRQLDRDFGPSMDQDFQEIIKDGLLADDYLDIRKVKDIEQKYLQTLAQLRFPNGWKIYEQRLQEIGESEAYQEVNGEIQAAYQRFITGVLNGTFREERYQTTSDHIRTIRQHHETVWQQWQEPDAGRLIKLGKTDYRVMNTDDWQDLLLSGTEVSGSCQRIDDHQDLNLGLLSYLLDGKIRMIAIKECETGQICARTLVKLMWDKRTQSPVLFLEKKYPKVMSQQMRAALDQYGVELAKKLALPLYSWEPNQKSLIEASHIVSLGSCVPYEYADSAGFEFLQFTHLMRQGRYALDHVYPVDLGLN